VSTGGAAKQHSMRHVWYSWIVWEQQEAWTAKVRETRGYEARQALGIARAVPPQLAPSMHEQQSPAWRLHS
jgi:hypothetical protein